MEKRKRIHVPKELYKRLEYLAKMNGVNVSEYVEHLVECQELNFRIKEINEVI